MKNLLIFFLFFLFSFNKLVSQDMTRKKFLDIEYDDISNKVKSEMLKKEAKAEKIKIGNTGEYYYNLSDGKILYDLASIKYYVFSSKQDFDYFINTTSKPFSIDNSISISTHPINDSDFIYKTDQYITFFTGIFELNLNFQNLEDLKKVDSLLNQISLIDYLKYRPSIVATLGEFIINHYKDALWKYSEYKYLDVSLRNPVIFAKSTNPLLIDPSTLVDEAYNKKLKKDTYRISLYSSLKKVIY